MFLICIHTTNKYYQNSLPEKWFDISYETCLLIITIIIIVAVFAFYFH